MMDNRSRDWRDSKTHDAPEVHYTNYPVALPPDEQGLQVVEEEVTKEYRRDGVAIHKEGRSRRKTWTWIAVAVILCLVGFGAGVGVGIAVQQGSSEYVVCSDKAYIGQGAHTLQVNTNYNSEFNGHVTSVQCNTVP